MLVNGLMGLRRIKWKITEIVVLWTFLFVLFPYILWII